MLVKLTYFLIGKLWRKLFEFLYILRSQVLIPQIYPQPTQNNVIIYWASTKCKALYIYFSLIFSVISVVLLSLFYKVSPSSNWLDLLPPENSLKQIDFFSIHMYNLSHFESITNSILELFIFLHHVKTGSKICFFHGYWKPSIMLSMNYSHWHCIGS